MKSVLEIHNWFRNASLDLDTGGKCREVEWQRKIQATRISSKGLMRIVWLKSPKFSLTSLLLGNNSFGMCAGLSDGSG